MIFIVNIIKNNKNLSFEVDYTESFVLLVLCQKTLEKKPQKMAALRQPNVYYYSENFLLNRLRMELMIIILTIFHPFACYCKYCK